MKKLFRNRAIMAGAVVLVAALFGASAMASDIVTIENGAAGTVTLDSSPIVTAILSQPGNFGGKAYTTWSFMVQDSTGSLDIYGYSGSLGYTPVVGDAITLNGSYSLYHQLPEIGTVTAISAVSHNNPVPAPLVSTIPALNVTTLPFSLAGYYIELDGVTINSLGTTTFPAANSPSSAPVWTIGDSGGNSMESLLLVHFLLQGRGFVRHYGPDRAD